MSKCLFNGHNVPDFLPHCPTRHQYPKMSWPYHPNPHLPLPFEHFLIHSQVLNTRPKENSRYDSKVKAKKMTGKKENPVDKFTALLNEENSPQAGHSPHQVSRFPAIPKGLCQTQASRTGSEHGQMGRPPRQGRTEESLDRRMGTPG
jgi:hypothetical protein